MLVRLAYVCSPLLPLHVDARSVKQGRVAGWWYVAEKSKPLCSFTGVMGREQRTHMRTHAKVLCALTEIGKL